MLRAASQILKSGEIQSGGSTLTQQLARDFFLSRKQVFSRKFNEILLSIQIEQEFTKEEILELFNNKMFFGNRAYGLQAAAQIYYGKDVQELTLLEKKRIYQNIKKVLIKAVEFKGSNELPAVILADTVSLNKNTSCDTNPIFFLSKFKLMSCIGVSSIKIFPLCGS